MKANALMKQNINALLRARGQTQKDLAVWCRRSESWISKILSEERREFPMKYFDRIADFFGITAYQLLQPGISPVTERRKGERRASGDRRIGHAVLSPAVDAADAALIRRWNALSYASRRRVEHWVDVLHLQEQAPTGSVRADPVLTADPQSPPVAQRRERKR